MIGGMLVESHLMQREKVDNMAQCFRCFSIEHVANQYQRTNPLCSICAEKHNFRDCPNKKNKSKLQCANCGGRHIAIAKSCPKRREKINEKENKEQQTNLQNQQQQKQPNNPLSLDNFSALNTRYNPSSQPPQHNTTIAWTNTNNQNTNTNITHNQQKQSPLTIQPCNINEEFKKHEWEIKLSIAKSCAEMAAKGNAVRFLEIMNSFLKYIGLSPLNILLDTHTQEPPTVTENNTATPNHPHQSNSLPHPFKSSVWQNPSAEPKHLFTYTLTDKHIHQHPTPTM